MANVPGGGEDNNFCGDTIFDLGWRQGSFLDSSSISVPEKIGNIQGDYYLVLCSQSCTVVSPDLKRDPYVELILALPQKKISPKSYESVGKNTRKLHLAVTGIPDCQGIELSINHKFEIDRSLLTGLHPVNGVSLAVADVKKLTNWLGRNYLRIALPNKLSEVLRAHFFPVLEGWLRNKVSGKAEIIHNYIDCVYMSWSPDAESDNYILEFLLLTDDADIQESFNDSLLPAIGHLMADNDNGFIISVMVCMLKEETYISDIDGYHRLSEYDYLTSMQDWVNMPVL